jgi:O-antigen/teichoic acid export membrane protein
LTYAVSATAAVAVATAFVIGTPFWASKLDFLLHDGAWFAAFVVATAIWCVFSLQDSVLAGLRRAPWVPIENIGVSVVKIALLLLLQSQLVSAGIFGSWMLPTALAVVIVNLLVFRVAVPSLASSAVGRHTLREIGRFAGGNYVGFVFYAASSNLLPLVVLNRAGASQAAYFFLPWAITSALLLVAASTATSLTVETVREMSRLQTYSRRTLVHTFALLAVPVALLLVAAPALLAVFGSDYAEHGTTPLRLLSLGVLPNAVVQIGLGVLRIRGRVWRLAALQALVCVILLGASWVLLPRHGITSVGIAFVLSQITAAVVLLGGDLRAIVRVRGEVNVER